MHKAINSLDDKTIAVRDKWKIKQQMSHLDTVRQFSPNTVTQLETEIAPLMQWVDVRGHSDAYQWDLLVSQIQQQKLQKSTAFDDLTGDAITQLWQLQMNLNQVRAKAAVIKQCRELSWWQSASLADIETARIELRGIMQHRDKLKGGGYEPPTIDITDGDEISEKQSTYLNTVDMVAYRVKIEQALKELFEQNPVLIKIHNGEAVTEAELNNLNALIHTNHPDIDLNVLKSFYDTAAPHGTNFTFDCGHGCGQG